MLSVNESFILFFGLSVAKSFIKNKKKGTKWKIFGIRKRKFQEENRKRKKGKSGNFVCEIYFNEGYTKKSFKGKKSQEEKNLLWQMLVRQMLAENENWKFGIRNFTVTSVDQYNPSYGWSVENILGVN